ncbi:MAG: ATP-binding protein, partial [Pseudomonadota bacterium]
FECLSELIDNVFKNKALIRQYDFLVSGINIEQRKINLQILPIENSDEIMLVSDDLGIAGKLNNNVFSNDKLNSAGNMAAILAHEIKNPLSGIRGAAQLLGKNANHDDKILTDLICKEVDRIRDVIEETEIFSDRQAIVKSSINIHEVLYHVRKLAETGFASHVHFKENYDPSIPEINANKNLLIQLFINLIKNAAEELQNHASPLITITTSYQSGFKFKPSGEDKIVALPIVISIQDNGGGIKNEMRNNLFDPFVSNKNGGKGLGLTIVAKIVADHGGIIELDEDVKSGTKFKILLPA